MNSNSYRKYSLVVNHFKFHPHPHLFAQKSFIHTRTDIYLLYFKRIISNNSYFSVLSYPKNSQLLSTNLFKFQQNQLKIRSSTLFKSNSNNDRPKFSKFSTFIT